MLCSDVMAAIRRTLNDEDKVTFPDSVVLAALNEALSALVLYRADASATTSVVQLAPGTRQSIPADGIRLIRLIRNRGSDGVQVGRSIRLVDTDVMDAIAPGWHQLSGNYVAEYTYDPHTPKEFYVYPAVPSGTVYVELSYSRNIPEAAANDTLPVDAIYSQALKEWALYVLWGGDTDSSPNYSQAIGRKQTFFDLLQVKSASDKATYPAIKGQ